MLKKPSIQRGGALVEFAVVAPVFLMMLFAIIELGLLLYSWHAVGNAADMGARFAMTRGELCLNTSGTDAGGNTLCPITSNAVKYYVQHELPGLNGTGATVTTNWYTDSTHGTSCAAETIGCVVNVNVHYPFKFNVPFFGVRNISLDGTSEMTITD